MCMKVSDNKTRQCPACKEKYNGYPAKILLSTKTKTRIF